MKSQGWLSILVVASFALSGCYTQFQMVEQQSSPRNDMPYYSWDEQASRSGELTEADSIYVEGYNDGVYDAEQVFYRDYNRLSWYRNNFDYINDYYGPSFGGSYSYWGPTGYYDPVYPHRYWSWYDSHYYWHRDPFFWHRRPFYRSGFHMSFSFGFYDSYYDPYWGPSFGYYGSWGSPYYQPYSYYTWWYNSGNYTKPVRRDRDFNYGPRASGVSRYPASGTVNRGSERSRYDNPENSGRPGVQRALPNRDNTTRSRYVPNRSTPDRTRSTGVRSTGRSGQQRATPPSNNSRNVRRQNSSDSGSSPASRQRNIDRTPTRRSSPASNSNSNNRSRNVRQSNDNDRSSSLMRSRLDFIRKRTREVNRPDPVPESRQRSRPVIRWNRSSNNGSSSFSFPKFKSSNSGSSNRSSSTVNRSSSNTTRSQPNVRSSSNTRSSSGSSRSRSSGSSNSGSNRSRNN